MSGCWCFEFLGVRALLRVPLYSPPDRPVRTDPSKLPAKVVAAVVTASPPNPLMAMTAGLPDLPRKLVWLGIRVPSLFFVGPKHYITLILLPLSKLFAFVASI